MSTGIDPVKGGGLSPERSETIIIMGSLILLKLGRDKSEKGVCPSPISFQQFERGPSLESPTDLITKQYICYVYRG